MAFINDYLTEEEIEKFKKRAIPYPAATGSKNIIGYHPYAGNSPLTRLKCTLNREENIYLFYCGMEKYDFNSIPKNNYFELVWDNELGKNSITIVVEQTIKRNEDKKGSMIICWKLINIFPYRKDKKDIIISKLKEALLTFGLKGDIESKHEWEIEFELGRDY